MKKTLFILLFLIGFSAFALNPKCKSFSQKAPAKITAHSIKKKKHKAPPMLLADLLLLPQSGS